MQVCQWQLLHQTDGGLKVDLALAGKTGNQVGGDEGVRQGRSGPFRHSAVECSRVTPLHPFQHSITAALQGDMQMVTEPI